MLTVLALSMAFADDMKTVPMQRADSGMMNVSALPMIDSDNWYLFGDVLYWKALEGATDWAIRSEEKSSLSADEHFRKVQFDWDWGFRVGVGGNLMSHDEWDMNLSYTWFSTEKKDAVGLKGPITGNNILFDNGGVLPRFQFPSQGNNTPNGMESGEIHWKIFFSMFDWEMGRNYYVSKHLALRPHVGVKGGWIHQNIRGHWHIGANTVTGADLGDQNYKLKNNFWGVGPSVGVNTKWVLGNVGAHMFNFFGDFAGALMYGRFDLGNEWSARPPNDSQDLTNMSRDLGATMLQGFMGFSWETNFNRNRCHFMMKLGYELQYWFNQNNLYATVGFNFVNGDLMLQGGTLDFRFDF